jgi:hypothetical protein
MHAEKEFFVGDIVSDRNGNYHLIIRKNPNNNANFPWTYTTCSFNNEENIESAKRKFIKANYTNLVTAGIETCLVYDWHYKNTIFKLDKNIALMNLEENIKKEIKNLNSTLEKVTKARVGLEIYQELKKDGVLYYSE